MHSTSTFAEPVTETHAVPQAGRRVAKRWNRAVEGTLLLVAGIFFALHFVHLKADFPNHSPWMDWSKYTDEGWYGDAAIRHYQLGHWNVPGDFNPAAALPVWPALEMVLFRVTGVSLAAARALTVVVFGLILLCCHALLRRWSAAWRGGVAEARSATGEDSRSWRHPRPSRCFCSRSARFAMHSRGSRFWSRCWSCWRLRRCMSHRRRAQSA